MDCPTKRAYNPLELDVIANDKNVPLEIVVSMAELMVAKSRRQEKKKP